MIPVIEYITNGVTESGSSGTLYEDLPKDEQISFLMLELRVTNSSTVNNARSILDVFSKIEVIADGKTLVSATPEILSYLAFVAQGGKVCDHRFFDGASAVSRLHLPIYFGRFPYDDEYMLDTSMYKNVQLQITWSMDTTYETSGSFQHTISYVRPLQKQSVLGFIRSRLYRQETLSAAVQTVRHDLPVDNPWFYVGVRVHDVDQDINTDLSKIDLNVNSGRIHLFDGDVDELLYYDKLRYHHANAYVNQPVVTGQDSSVHTFAEWAFPRGAVYVGTGARIIGVDSVAGEQCRITVMTDAGAQATDAVPVALEVKSQNPHKCLTLFDGRKQPFPAQEYSESWVDYEAAAYAQTLYTFVQEIISGAL